MTGRSFTLLQGAGKQPGQKLPESFTKPLFLGCHGAYPQREVKGALAVVCAQLIQDGKAHGTDMIPWHKLPANFADSWADFGDPV